MRAPLLLLGLLSLGSIRAAPAEAADPLLAPLAIPGYALRVLDVQKKVILTVRGAEVEASVPVFVYWPAPERAEAVRRVRQARDGLARLQEKREWSAAELREILSGLDAGLGELEREARP